MVPVRKDGSKVYIEGVRKISWATGEVCEFASALTAALECLGERVPYAYVMGMSGAAFRFTLKPGQWEPGNYGIRNISADPNEPIRRAFEAVGWEYTQYERSSKQHDMAAITASIDRGVPVLAFAVVGPADCSIIAGYDEGGEVLMGWSTYQDIPFDHNIPHDSTGYFRKPGWHDNLPGYIVIGRRVSPPPRRETHLAALQWAVQLARSSRLVERATGLEALGVWADEMTDERYFPQGNAQVLGDRYLGMAICLTMLDDHRSAAPFLAQMAAEEADLAPGLTPAIACYTEASRLSDSLRGLIKDDFSEDANRRMADPQVRQEYARVILRIRDKEAEGIGYVERLLECLT